MKRKDIEKLHADGLISEELRDKILAHYRWEEGASGRWLFICLSLLAAALIAGGVGMLVAAHWEDLTALGKVVSGVVLLAAVWALSIALQRPVPLLAEGLALLGAVLWGGNLALHCFLFDPGTPPVEFVFIFFAGIVFLPFLTHQRLLVGVVALTSLVLVCGICADSEGSWLHIPWLADESKLRGNIVAALSLLGLAWWLIGEKARGSSGLLRGYYWVGIMSFLIWLSVGQHYMLYAKSIHDELMLSWQGGVLLAAAPVLCLLLKPRGVGWVLWLLMTAATCSLTPLAIHLSWVSGDWHPLSLFGEMGAELAISSSAAIGVAACTAYAILLMVIGSRSSRIAWINYGSLMGVFVIIGVLSNIFSSLENSGLALIIAGSLVLLVVFLLESQRRHLVRKIKQQNSSEA